MGSLREALFGLVAAVVCSVLLLIIVQLSRELLLKLQKRRREQQSQNNNTLSRNNSFSRSSQISRRRRHSQQYNAESTWKDTETYITAVMSLLLGIVFLSWEASIKILQYFDAFEAAKLRDCTNVWGAPLIWLMTRLWVQLSFLARISQTFKGSAFALSSYQKRMIISSLLGLYVPFALICIAHFVAEAMMDRRNNREWRDDRNDEPSHQRGQDYRHCVTFILNDLRHHRLLFISVICFFIVDTTLTILQLRIYLRKLHPMSKQKDPPPMPADGHYSRHHRHSDHHSRYESPRSDGHWSSRNLRAPPQSSHAGSNVSSITNNHHNPVTRRHRDSPERDRRGSSVVFEPSMTSTLTRKDRAKTETLTRTRTMTGTSSELPTPKTPATIGTGGLSAISAPKNADLGGATFAGVNAEDSEAKPTSARSDGESITVTDHDGLVPDPADHTTTQFPFHSEFLNLPSESAASPPRVPMNAIVGRGSPPRMASLDPSSMPIDDCEGGMIILNDGQDESDSDEDDEDLGPGAITSLDALPSALSAQISDERISIEVGGGGASTSCLNSNAHNNGSVGVLQSPALPTVREEDGDADEGSPLSPNRTELVMSSPPISLGRSVSENSVFHIQRDDLSANAGRASSIRRGSLSSSLFSPIRRLHLQDQASETLAYLRRRINQRASIALRQIHSNEDHLNQHHHRQRMMVIGFHEEMKRLAARNSFLALTAMIATPTLILCLFPLLGTLVFTLDLMISGVCIYFCFPNVSDPVFNRVCVPCFECSNRMCMPALFVICDWQPCQECSGWMSYWRRNK